MLDAIKSLFGNRDKATIAEFIEQNKALVAERDFLALKVKVTEEVLTKVADAKPGEKCLTYQRLARDTMSRLSKLAYAFENRPTD